MSRFFLVGAGTGAQGKPVPDFLSQHETLEEAQQEADRMMLDAIRLYVDPEEHDDDWLAGINAPVTHQQLVEFWNEHLTWQQTFAIFDCDKEDFVQVI